MKGLAKLSLWILLTLLVSCNHHELCYHHPHTAQVQVNVDWSEFVEEQPTGMTVMVYPADGSKPYSSLTHTLDHASFNLPEGMYHTLVFNQSVSEFGSLEFRQMEAYDKAEVVSSTEDSRWYEARAEGGRVVRQSEWIAIHREESKSVTRQMVEELRPEGKYRTGDAGGYVLSNLVPHNIIYTIHVRVYIEGIYNLRSARASLGGLAEGYWLGKGKPTANKVTHLLEEWKMTLNEEDPTKGFIEAQITCFGLPDGHQGKPEENELMLSLLLVDNKTILDFPFQVGDKFEASIEEDVRLQLNLTLEVVISTPLPDVEPEGGSGSGFSATVDDWGEEEKIDISFLLTFIVIFVSNDTLLFLLFVC